MHQNTNYSGYSYRFVQMATVVRMAGTLQEAELLCQVTTKVDRFHVR